MDLTPEEQSIKADLDKYLEDKDFRYNPDEDVVRRVIKGMAARKAKTGMALCPCRLATGDPEKDRKIVCPCEYHEKEIAEQGMCHCQLFVAPEKPGTSDETT